MARCASLLVVLFISLLAASSEARDLRPRSVPQAPGSKYGNQVVFPLHQGFKKPPADVRKRVPLGLPVTNPPIWTAEVGLGTPPQNIHVLIDTGSSNLATVPPSGCSGCTTSASYAFDPSDSSTWQTLECGTPRCTPTSCATCNSGSTCTYDLLYGDGSTIAGNVGVDRFELGGYVIPNATYGTTTEISPDFFADDADSHRIGGIMGLAFTRISCWQDPSPVQQLLFQTPSLYKGFTLCLQNGGGEWILGEDYSTSGNTYQWVDFIDPTTAASGGYYTTALSGMGVNGTPLPGVTATDYAAARLIVDSGTTLNYVSQTIFNALTSELYAGCVAAGFDADSCDLIYTDPAVDPRCFTLTATALEELPTMSLSLQYGSGSSITLQLPPSVYFAPCGGSFVFSFSVKDSMFFIGNSIMRWYRVAHDINNLRLGFGAPEQCAGFTGYTTGSTAFVMAPLSVLFMLCCAAFFMLL